MLSSVGASQRRYASRSGGIAVAETWLARSASNAAGR